MLIDFLKIMGLVIILIFIWLFLQKYTNGDLGWASIGSSNGRLAVTDAELWDDPSPHRGTILIMPNSTPTESNPSTEYIYLKASQSNESPINLSGWSLRSVVQDTRIYIPPATLLLSMTDVNSVGPVYLAPSEYAILHTNSSPVSHVATSFHTNVCIGYLEQFNSFTPPLKKVCNNPKDILPATPENVRTYGSECINFLSRARTCTTYTTAMPAELLPACRDLVARKLTYHACLSEAYGRDGFNIFNKGGWYLYLNHEAEIWRNNYDALQLLDAEGKVVDVLRY